jgi:hypothetical protein
MSCNTDYNFRFQWNLPRARTTEQAISRAVHLHDNKNRWGIPWKSGNETLGALRCRPSQAAIVVMSQFVSD